MVGGLGIGVPVGVQPISTLASGVGTLVLRDNKGLIKMVLAVHDVVSLLLAKQALDLLLAGVVEVSTPAPTVAATMAMISMTMVTATATMTTTSNVRRRGGGATMEQIHPLLKGLQLCGELSDSDQLNTSQNRHDDGVVLKVEPSADVGNKFLIIDGFAHCCHFISEGTHLADVFLDRHGSLLHSCKRDASVHCACLGLRCKQRLYCHP